MNVFLATHVLCVIVTWSHINNNKCVSKHGWIGISEKLYSSADEIGYFQNQ